MNSNKVIDKILIFGEDDYVFADMFIAIVSELNDSTSNTSVVENTFSILEKLLKEGLINIFILRHEKGKLVDVIKYKIINEGDIALLIENINRQWKQFNYNLPEPDQLFWITTTDKGLEKIKS